MKKRPGGEMGARPLHFIWMADCSGSMSIGGKIQSLNRVIREATPHMQNVAKENPHADVQVRAIKFSTGAQWHIATATPVEDFKWTDLNADGVTHMGKALSMVADQMKTEVMGERGLPPVLVMVSDGQPTDDFSTGLQALLEQGWGKKAVRMAIAIGEDADHGVLQKFIDHPERKPLQANNPETLVKHIKWVSTAVLKAASSPASQTGDEPSSSGDHVLIPKAAGDDDGPSSADDVW